MLGEGTIGRLRQINDRALMDRCVRLVFTAGTMDAYGLDRPETYEEGATLPCLFRKLKPGEAMEQTEVATIAGQLRLPKGTTMDARDRIRLTHLHGDALAAAQTYKIVGEPQDTYVGLVLNLELVTDGS
jgi:hypothetical protein